MSERSPIILAIDTIDLNHVKNLIDSTLDYISVYKFGLEFYLRHGLSEMLGIKEAFGIEIFLDLKLHDIPNTVKKSAEAISEIKPHFLTVHAAGGAEMVRAASDALPESKIAAVTILTSLDQASIDSLGMNAGVEDLVQSLAGISVASGARALVASPHEVRKLKAKHPSTTLITPGIRTGLDERGDQRRTMTPAEAIREGSDYLVIGRPITQSHSPRDAASMILDSL